jgi:hypothetical protein
MSLMWVGTMAKVVDQYFKLDPAAAFILMQTYRGIQSPSGVYPGPRRGFSVEVIKSTLESIGATII